MTEVGSQDVKGRRKSNGHSNSGGFQAMGLSEEVYRGIVKMGFRVSYKIQVPVIGVTDTVTGSTFK